MEPSGIARNFRECRSGAAPASKVENNPMHSSRAIDDKGIFQVLAPAPPQPSPPDLIARAPQRRLEPVVLLVPVGIFCIQPRLDPLDFGSQSSHALGVLFPGLVQSLLRLVDGPLPALVLFPPRRLLLGLCALAALPLAFVRLSGFPVVRLG